MTLRLALSLLDLLSKVYFNDIVFAPLAFTAIQLLLTRYIEMEPFQEYTFKLCKVAAAAYYGSIQSKRENPNIKDPALVFIYHL